MILHMPLPQMLNAITTARATKARNQFAEALLTAEGASESPIQIMIGPVTTGGRNLITFLTPTSLITTPRTKYKRPAITIPPQA